MAGHSKWKNNLGRKTSQDAKRSASFGKLSRAITIAVIEGGSPEPNFNPRLRVAIDKAKESSMPRDNIERAIGKGSGPDKNSLHSILYEIFGPGGVNILAIATSDNPNRTNGEVHSLVEKRHGKMGKSGSAQHLFVHCCVVAVQNPTEPAAEELLLGLTEALQADDLVSDAESTHIYFPFVMFGKSSEIVQSSGLAVLTPPQTIYKPLVTMQITDDIGENLGTLLSTLEEHDDVHEVFHNAV
ncbi:YebC/PmpR family DNA-binding transcriptional regulator [Candidatus Woesebacteria bacterium]|nr:YebC/PmpR family DNA-binding transcriptional regulator [Candidatus Woesebacteria bacterium]